MVDNLEGITGEIVADSVMDAKERRERLSQLARNTDFSRQFHVSDSITAIDTLNKMDNIYKQTVHLEHEVIHTFIFQLPDGTLVIPGLTSKPVLELEADTT